MANDLCPHLCFIDNWSDFRIVVDTGIPRSLWPATAAQIAAADHIVRLFGGDAAQILTYGTLVRPICLGEACVPYCVEFLLADVPVPLLGADFLQDTGLLVNMRDRSLTVSDPLLSHAFLNINGMPEHGPHTELFHFGPPACIRTPEIFRRIQGDLDDSPQDPADRL